MVPHPLGYAKDVFELPEGYQVKNVEYGDMKIKVYIGPSEKSHWESGGRVQQGTKTPSADEITFQKFYLHLFDL